jgi:hypothetical protein
MRCGDCGAFLRYDDKDRRGWCVLMPLGKRSAGDGEMVITIWWRERGNGRLIKRSSVGLERGPIADRRHVTLEVDEEFGCVKFAPRPSAPENLTP